MNSPLRTSSKALVIALATLGTAAHAGDDVVFYGLAIGKPLLLVECATSMVGTRLDYQLGSPKTEPCYKRKSTKPGSSESVNNELVSITWPLLGGPDIGVPGAMGARVLDGVVQYVELYTRGARVQERAFDQLVEKFGKPTASVERAVQTRMGVKIDSIDATWTAGTVKVQLLGITSSLDQGQVIVGTEAGLAAQKAAIDAVLGPRPKM